MTPVGAQRGALTFVRDGFIGLGDASVTRGSEAYLSDPKSMLDDIQRRWLTPLSRGQSALHRLLYAVTWCGIRALFRFDVTGLSSLPCTPPVIFAPSHQSSLDAPLLAAAMPYHILRQTRWTIRKGRALANPILRQLNRVARAVPVDRDLAALAVGAAILRQKENLVWFPEGTRSRDGQLQEFKFGVGALARYFDVPVVPVGIQGAFEAYPPHARLPSLGTKVSVRFGQRLMFGDIPTPEDTAEADQAFADRLRDRVQRLKTQAD